jgi:16S rRNA processing protein RimM
MPKPAPAAERVDRDALVCVAAVAAAHGVRGELKLRCFTEHADGVGSYGPLYGADGALLFAIEVLRTQGNVAYVRAFGIADRNAAEALRGVELFVPRAALPPTEPDEFYHEDLVGLPVRTRAGQEIGRVRALHDFGAGDVIEVALLEGGTLDLPFTREAVPEIDLGARVVVVDPPAELRP